MSTLYDADDLYDLAFGEWASETQVAFYAELARAHGGDCLELGCGTGRVTLPLAAAGVTVTGLDNAPAMLARARQKAAVTGAAVTWTEGDFRDFDLGRRFGTVIFPINTIAHLPERADFEACMARVRAHLAPDGRFVIHYFVPHLGLLSRDPDVSHPVCDIRDAQGQMLATLTERTRYDPIHQVNAVRWHFAFTDGHEAELTFAMRIFYPAELEALLHYNGLAIEARYADFSGTPLDSQAQAQVVVCRARDAYE